MARLRRVESETGRLKERMNTLTIGTGAIQAAVLGLLAYLGLVKP